MLLEPIVAIGPFEIGSIDIVGSFKKLPNENRYVSCLLKNLKLSKTAAAAFKIVILHHECPHRILTDQGTQFSSGLLKHLYSKHGIEKYRRVLYIHKQMGK
jgi:hypothetical protein